MIKPLLLNTSDRGGAAASCLRLHNGLLNHGVNSRVLFERRSSQIRIPYSDSLRIEETLLAQKCNKPPVWQKIQREIRRIGIHLGVRGNSPPSKALTTADQAAFVNSRPRGLEMYSFPYSSCDITKTSAYLESNIINLHWVSGFLDWDSFFSTNRKPVIWTLHDQNPFLGGEHYAERYLGIDEDGRPCPRIYSDREILMDRILLDFKKEALRNTDNIHIVTPSRWLMECSQQSELFHKHPHYHIPNGFPTEIFMPRNKAASRECLKIPLDKIVLLYVSDTLENNRKGFPIFEYSVEKLPATIRNDLLFCAVGENSHISSHSQIMEFGRIDDEETMAMAYSAADAFIIPSLEDNLPNTMIEAILCGTPVIGFDTGGIPEAIIHGTNGFISKELSADALSKTIELFLTCRNTLDRESIAADAKANYNDKLQAERYTALYEDILCSMEGNSDE